MAWLLGSTITLRIGENTRIYTVADVPESAPTGHLDYQTPLGQVLLGTNIGKIAVWQNAAGKSLQATVIAVESSSSFEAAPLHYHSDAIKQKYALEQAEHCLVEFGQSQDLWKLSQASSFFRDAKQPKRALEITEGVVGSTRALQSALLTTRAAAYLDLHHSREAQKLVHQAVKISGWTSQLYSVQANKEEAAHYGRLAEGFRG